MYSLYMVPNRMEECVALHRTLCKLDWLVMVHNAKSSSLYVTHTVKFYRKEYVLCFVTFPEQMTNVQYNFLKFLTCAFFNLQAQQFHYRVEIREPNTPWKNEVVELTR